MGFPPAAPHVAALTDGGSAAVEDFLRRVPRGEYHFFKEDISAPGVLHAWRSQRNAVISIATLDGDIAGLVAVLPGLGWSRHVGSLRMVVDPMKRGRGVGAALARSALRSAVDAGLLKVTVEVLSEQTAVQAIFTDLGFVGEALLTDQVLDENGEFHDLLVFAHPVNETWASVTAMGVLDEEVAR